MRRFGDGPRRRRMIRGTIVRIGGHTMRPGPRPAFALQDCTSSQRSTVMCALPRATAVTTEYQRDSSSKRPRSSVVSAARAPTQTTPTGCQTNARDDRQAVACRSRCSDGAADLALDRRSFHISVRTVARAILRGRRRRFHAGAHRVSPSRSPRGSSRRPARATVCGDVRTNARPRRWG
jgi:hypothetical protein